MLAMLWSEADVVASHGSKKTKNSDFEGLMRMFLRKDTCVDTLFCK